MGVEALDVGARDARVDTGGTGEGEKGEILGYWAMPVNSWVMAIDGNSIIVRYNFNKQAMSISKTGNISLVDPINSISKQVKCP